MIGPMKKKVITSSVVTAIILVLVFVAIAFVYVSNTNEKIAELEKKGEVVQRYVFTENMLIGDVVTASDVTLVDVKGESAARDSYSILSPIIGKRLKVNANAQTIVTGSLFFEDEADPDLDTRLQEFNMITLPSDLDEGDYVDIRIRFATGEDYSVLVAKKIESFGALGTESNTIFLRLSEEEILRISSAIIESYIRDGVYLYANKYVDSDNQLHDYARVNFVSRYEAAEYEVISGDALPDGEAALEYIADGDSYRRQRSLSEIASIIGLNLEETENIQIALNDNDNDTLEYYKDKLVVTDKSIITNYPVKKEVATLIQSNPNILNDIKAKYNIEKLEQERINFLDTNLTKVDELTGEVIINDAYISSVNDKLQKEITLQKTERQEYLLNLLSKQQAGTSTAQ